MHAIITSSAALLILYSFLAFAGEKVFVFVEYKHGDVHVHYSLPCEYNTTCVLNSFQGAETSWKIDVRPTKLSNGIVSVQADVFENAKQVQAAEIRTKLGEAAKLVSSDPEGRKTKLTLRPF